MNNFNMDLSLQVVIDTNIAEKISSPSSGVERIPLEREEAESGRTTSVVTYLPGASFNKHNHPLGEEIFVLDGIFSDEYGDYPSGTYLRNPPGTSHAPFSELGCTLLVKLHQMDPTDKSKVIINTNKEQWRAGHGNLEVMPLHSFNTEGVALVKWPKGEKFLLHKHYGGEEIFVLKGEFIDEHGKYPKGTWIRSPHLSTHHPYVEEETIIYVKTGHLI
jgi:anti-sigma factor ChrR (cupin superfamily)